MNVYENFIRELDPVEQIVLCQILCGDRISAEFQAKRTPLMTENILLSLARQYLTVSRDSRSASILSLITSLDYNDEKVICEFNELVSTEGLYVLVKDIDTNSIENPKILWNFGIVQQRLFLAMLTKANWLPNEEEYYLPTEFLRQICPNLRDLRAICGSMVNLQFSLNDNSVYAFSEIFIESDGIHFLLNPIINWEKFKKQFGDLALDNILKFRSNRTIPLYVELLSAKTSHPEEDTFYMTMDELRNKLGIANDEYGKLSDFRRRVLEPAIFDIQQHLGAKIAYTINKDANKTLQISFNVKESKSN